MEGGGEWGYEKSVCVCVGGRLSTLSTDSQLNGAEASNVWIRAERCAGRIYIAVKKWAQPNSTDAFHFISEAPIMLHILMLDKIENYSSCRLSGVFADPGFFFLTFLILV